MRSSAAFYIFEVKLKQKKVDCKIFCNEKVLYVTLFTTKKCCSLHFLQRKSVVSYTFYNEKMLNATLFTAKKCDGFVLFLTDIPQQKIIVNDGFNATV